VGGGLGGGGQGAIRDARLRSGGRVATISAKVKHPKKSPILSRRQKKRTRVNWGRKGRLTIVVDHRRRVEPYRYLSGIRKTRGNEKHFNHSKGEDQKRKGKNAGGGGNGGLRKKRICTLGEMGNQPSNRYVDL